MYFIHHLTLLILSWIGSSVSQVCAPYAIPYPELFGAQITSLTAYERLGYALEVPQGNNQFAQNVSSLNFCNVNITYTHPGANDSINVQVWLPLSGWNGRFQGAGGGGYATGTFDFGLAPAAAQGFAAVSTDGGHNIDAAHADGWALHSPGIVNYDLLLDFSSRALHDMTVLGKAVTQSYYGVAPNFSYWNGCSTGGRQGHMMAQRYPNDYDGILASAPAINWPSFIVAEYWGELVMNQLAVYPLQCEFDDFAAAAIEACDGLDGLLDGIIAAPGLCRFDPHSLVGQLFNCSGFITYHSSAAATIVQAVWEGPRMTDGSFMWYGLNPGTAFDRLVNTTCADNGTCYGTPFVISEDWIRLWVEKMPTFATNNMSYADYDVVFHQSNLQYSIVIGTDDPDLTQFRDTGGKMISWHGLIDQLIYPNGTVQYYERVMAADPGVHDYYRFFEAPGVAHCGGGVGPFPGQALDSIIQWVEKGVAPDTLAGESLPVNGTVRYQPLCPYPLVSAYKGGDPTQASSFECATSFNSASAAT